MSFSKQNKQIQVTKRASKPPVQRQIKNSPQAILQRAQGDPQNLSQDDVIQLQRTIGNKATTDLIQRGMWDRMFGTTRKPRKQFSASPRPGMSAGQESQSIMKQFRRQLREERKARLAYTYYKRSAAQKDDQFEESEKERLGNDYKLPLTVKKLLLNEVAWAYFREFCKTEESIENPNFIDFAIDRNKLVNTPAEGPKRVRDDLTNRQAIALWNSFAKTGATYEINISYRTRKRMGDQINALKARLSGGEATYAAGPVSVETGEMTENPRINRWDATASPELLKTFDQALIEIYRILNDTNGRFRESEHAKYALLAIKEHAKINTWAPQYASFMNFYETEERRKENTVSYEGRSWWQKMIGWSN